MRNLYCMAVPGAKAMVVAQTGYVAEDRGT